MAFQVSPGVNVTETDLTGIVPAVATTTGAFGGVFRWGPIGIPALVGSETQLVSQFGKPTNFNAESFFTCANFLGYAQALYVARAANTTGVSNTQSVNMSNGSANLTANGIAILGSNTSGLAYSVAGPGIAANTQVVSWTANQIVLSSNATLTNTAQIVAFYNSNAAFSAVAAGVELPTSPLASLIVANPNQYIEKQGDFDTNVQWIAKYPGLLGNSLTVSVCDSAQQYQSNINFLESNNVSNAYLSFGVGSNVAVLTVSNSATGNDITSATWANTIIQQLTVGDFLVAGNVATIGTQKINVTGIGAVVPTLSGQSNTGTCTVQIALANPYGLSANVQVQSVVRQWQYVSTVGSVPGQTQYVSQFGNTAANDALHVVIVDSLGAFSGVPGTVLETYQNLSRATDAKTQNGQTNYYATVISSASQYVWYANDRPGALSANAYNVASSTNKDPYNVQMEFGSDGDGETVVPVSVLAGAYGLFQSSEDIDVSLIMTGKARITDGISGEQIPNYLIQNVVQDRNDCVLFVSPPLEDVVNNKGYEATDIVAFRNNVTSTSYAVMDSGYKYQYDKYNDVYRWIPLNGDIAGLCAYTDQVQNPWWSPAGFNRGQINNVVRLAYNPKQADRDLLYVNGVNPVVTFPGQGTILYGDKTLLSQPSAFDRINVRRLFIVIEKAISTAAQNELFEFNDAFTQAAFVNMIDPYLRNIEGLRGIQDYLIVCDSTNNTPTVIDANQFVATIYVKPARSINFIQLNFVAVATGVDFTEITGTSTTS
jgi:hypothetical protein